MEDYFNYGYNDVEWDKYASNIRNKFEELSKLVQKNKIHLKTEKDALTYLLNFPSDFGGLGEIFGEEYDNVNLFDIKTNMNKMIPTTKGDQVYVGLEQAQLQNCSCAANLNSSSINSSNINGNIPINCSETFNSNINVPQTNCYLTTNNTFFSQQFPFNYFPRPFSQYLSVNTAVANKALQDNSRYVLLYNINYFNICTYYMFFYILFFINSIFIFLFFFLYRADKDSHKRSKSRKSHKSKKDSSSSSDTDDRHSRESKRRHKNRDKSKDRKRSRSRSKSRSRSRSRSRNHKKDSRKDKDKKKHKSH